MWSGIGISRRAMAFKTFVLPLPFTPMNPYLVPTFSSSVASSSSGDPATVTENFSILVSLAVGLDASTPVTALCFASIC